MRFQASIDDSGFNKKMNALRGLADAANSASKAASSYVQFRIVQEVLNHGWVGVDTGNLRRSQEFKQVGTAMQLFFTNITVAPYAPTVNMRLQAAGSMGTFRAINPPDGRTYYQIVTDLYGSETAEKMEGAVIEYVEAINQGRQPRFKNPFAFG